MWNGFDFYYFYLDRIIRIFFACGEGPVGRRPYDPNDPVDPVQFFLRSESIPLFHSKIRVSYLIRLAVFLAVGRASKKLLQVSSTLKLDAPRPTAG